VKFSRQLYNQTSFLSNLYRQYRR